MNKYLGALKEAASTVFGPPETHIDLLRRAAENFGAVDGAIVDKRLYGDIIDRVERGELRHASAVAEMRRRSPALFKPYDKMNNKEFADAEDVLRQGLRDHPRREFAYGDLDAALLTDEELMHYELALISGNRFDHGVLARARARQRGAAA